MDDEKARAILDLLTVPNFNQVYTRGCFAKYVTLYSQQVRALNLVAALNRTGVIQAGTKVIVVGAGASGVTASAAAALLGADVKLFDRLEGAMELQYNNRQRWIHPYVYDWPDMERTDTDRPEGNRTHFPVNQLNWTAGYAYRVAEQIESGWSAIVRETGRIRCVWQAKVHIQKFIDETYIDWESPDGSDQEHDAVTILAVGFGLEDDQDWAWSYWDDDDIDGTFRKPAEKPRWLVSGYGDGALTDVMRLCIRRFRHHEIMTLFEKSDHIDGVKRDLREIQQQSKTQSPAWVHDQFVRLATRDLDEKLRTRLRKDGPEVYLTGRSPLIYGPESSILNRLIVRLLQKLHAVRYVPGEPAEFDDQGKQTRGGVGTVKKTMTGGFLVDLAKSAQSYQRVICRHGTAPSPHPGVREFDAVYKNCAPLIAIWDKLAPSDDPTRTPNWPPDFLREKRPVAPATNERRQYHVARRRLGLQAKAMSIYKEVRDDGGSTVSYQIDELSVDKGKIEGLWCRIKFTAGVVGAPSLNAAALQLGMKWIPQPRSESAAAENPEQALYEIIERNRQVAGTLKFGRPLRAGDPVISFGFSVEVLNGDALSPWEFEEMYSDPADRIHIDQKPIEDIEYFARIVWFPVESLHMRLKIPEKITATPSVSLFECSTPPQDITRGEIAPNSILHLYPSPESSLSPRSVEWKRSDYPKHAGDEPLFRATQNRWELSIRYPPVGSCYSIDFNLGRAEGGSDDSGAVAREALAFRRHLVSVAGPFDQAGAFRRSIREQLSILNDYAGQYRADSNDSERFEITFASYNDDSHRMTVVDGLLNGGELDPGMWSFELPFGVGLAGVTFKQGDRVFYHVSPEEGREQSGPEFYVELPSQPRISVLVSVPLDHSGYRASMPIERGRQCVGVVNFLSTHVASGLKRITEDKAARDELWRTCQNFCRAIQASAVINKGQVYTKDEE